MATMPDLRQHSTDRSRRLHKDPSSSETHKKRRIISEFRIANQWICPCPCLGARFCNFCIKTAVAKPGPGF